jgi:acyl-CoA thioester hydrolase
MGVVYYGHYPAYFEVGRAEFIRHMGITYKSIEESGVLMPVASLEVKYISPARYDDLLTIKTSLPELPDRRIIFESSIFNDSGQILAKGIVTLAFIDSETRKPCRAPNILTNLFNSQQGA